MPAAKVSAYALTAHSRVPIDPPTLWWIAGSAVTTTSASSDTMKNETAVSTSTSPGDAALAGAAAPGTSDLTCTTASRARSAAPGRRRPVN
jgi:hypothetical protein